MLIERSKSLVLLTTALTLLEGHYEEEQKVTARFEPTSLMCGV
jgi:hypothetical protein